MSSFVDFFKEVFIIPSSVQTLVILSLVSFFGLLLSKLKFGIFSLGITFVFFVGILVAHLGIRVEDSMLSFAQNFGLVLFIYALGVQVGPSFFSSLKKGGIRFNLYSLLLISVTLLLCVAFHFLLKIAMPDMIGIMSGAVTNTPMLAAAQSTLSEALSSSGDLQSNMALACAVTYPLGVVGMLLVMLFLYPLKKKRGAKEEEKHIQHTTFFTEFEVQNQELVGLDVENLAKKSLVPFVISRLWRNGVLSIPNSKTVLSLGDHFLVASHEEDVPVLEKLFGQKVSKDWNREDIDWDSIDSQLVSKQIIITQPNVNGVKLGALKLRTLYGINITRIMRSGIELFASPSLRLQLGDRIVIVGEKNAVDITKKKLGDEISMLDAPNLLSFFLGLLVGCIVGMIPFYIPGLSMPVKLGLAGGPILIGILMGAFGPRFHMSTYITTSASLLLRQLGLILYLGALGLASGEHFFEVILKGDGLLWVAIGLIITIVPTWLVGFITIRFFKRPYGETCGMLCGSMANPMVLDFLADKVPDDTHNVVYATVYPISMFLRILTAQVLLLYFIT